MKVFEVDGSTLSLALFSDVMNSNELLDAIQIGRLEPEVAFLNASLVPDMLPVLVAAHKTFLAKSREALTTRTQHSELVYNYSGSKHMKNMEKLINGREINLEELKGRANQAQIQKHYKISDLELGISSLAEAITCQIATRNTWSPTATGRLHAAATAGSVPTGGLVEAVDGLGQRLNQVPTAGMQGGSYCVDFYGGNIIDGRRWHGPESEPDLRTGSGS
ncbi:hypothetical protein NE237_023994 [Protea cynaroides]|uniref:Uncharacterized protein n=1 Tax=Protea cynaroides TaxID=273540 RepID=A0A9Q0K6J7_9MAGN|nr:hypothetical protein NE237_023994 [Protea cynaroides]